MPLTMLPNGTIERVQPRKQRLIVYTVDLGRKGRTYPFGRETFALREDAERFIEEVRGDDPDGAAKLRIEERELEAGGLN